MKIGDDNFSSVNQAPSNNAKATVAQTGNANQSYVDQTLALTGGDNTTAKVAQTGNRNYSYVDQSAAENDAFVTHTNHDSTTHVLQSYRKAVVRGYGDQLLDDLTCGGI